MQKYRLHNKKNNKDLMHPSIGMWYAKSLAEAQEMLQACHEYLDASGHTALKEDIVIKPIIEAD